MNLRQLEHVATSLPHRCHLGDNGQVVNNKANLKPILGNQCTESERRADLRFLVACEGLGVTKKSKSSDVRGCVCVVLVHQPVKARLVFVHWSFLILQHLEAVLLSLAMLSMARW